MEIGRERASVSASKSFACDGDAENPMRKPNERDSECCVVGKPVLKSVAAPIAGTIYTVSRFSILKYTFS
jgi:hypothetical protein